MGLLGISWWYWGIGAIIAVAIIFVIILYNGLILKKNRIKNARAQIDVQTKKRYDLVPNLVEMVKGYMKYEKTVLESVTKARTSLMQAGSTEQKLKANDGMTKALKTLFAVAENYPNLKASENFLQLQNELSGIESKIAYSRQFYND
ncbi:MAG: LemA family protein, partial [Candidatus Micrarchaeota archaeon]